MGVRKDSKSTFSHNSHGTCDVWAGHCPARVEHSKSVLLSSFLRLSGVAASIRLHYMHRLSCDLAQDNQS